ncbi:MAG: hypothetical protein Rubg2KO_28100 [Rubricoccaceae bacterium]
MDGYSFPDQNIETVVGNGRLIARARAGSAEFVFEGPADGFILQLDGTSFGDHDRVGTEVRPGRSIYDLPMRGTVTYAAQPDALVFLVLVEAAPHAESAEWSVVLTGEGVSVESDELATARGRARVWCTHGGDAKVLSAAEGTLSVRLDGGERAAFILGDAEAVTQWSGNPFEAVDAWEEGYRQRGVRLRTPNTVLNTAVDFAKAHMQLGYDWRPDDASSTEGGAKMVCDIFRWRDVWSRDFGSGFGPGALASHLYEGVLDTLDYEAARHRAHDPTFLKVSDDTSQGGSAEGIGWLMKLIWRVYKHTGDTEWLARMTEAFEPWMQVWIDRDADQDGLVADVTEWMDHSRFLRLVEGQRTLYSNVLYRAALRRFAHICEALGRDADAERYRDLSDRSRTAIQDAFWNDEGGYFNNAVQWGIPDTALMLADNAIALQERIVSRNDRFRTLEAIKTRNWRTFGSVTTDLPMKYVPSDNDHNGKVWPWWMAHEAKARFQNYDAEGGLHILNHIASTFSRPTLPGLCEEYLNPDDGSQDDVVGHAFITGSGALLEAVLYGLVGLAVLEPGERVVRLAPVVPRDWDDWSVGIDLFKGSIHFEETAEGYRVQTEGARVETLELRIPPREAVELVMLDGAEVEPERTEDGASTTLRFALTPGSAQCIEVGFAQRRAWSGDLVLPGGLPAPVQASEAFLMDEPRLFADILQSFVRAAASYFGSLRHVAAREIDELTGADDLLLVVGNEMPYLTKQGESVTEMLDGYLSRGGSLLLLGPRFPRIDVDTAHYHGGAQMGGHAGMFWWKAWRDGHWVDYDPRAGEVLPHPVHEGTVYWGDGPLFAAWEHTVGLFGFETDACGVYDVEGNVVDPDQEIDIVYTDWAVRRPWTFTPLAFTERERQLVTGPRRERYPCAALLQNEETGARIVVVSPTICSRVDLLHRFLGAVAVV